MAMIAPLLGVFASLAGSFMNKPSAPAPAPVQQEPTKEPEGDVDREAAKARSLARARTSEQQSLLKLIEEEDQQTKNTTGV